MNPGLFGCRVLLLNHYAMLTSILICMFYLFILKFILFIYFWLHWVFVAVRGLFSSCSERGLLFVAVQGLLIAVATFVVEHGLGTWASVVVAHRLSSCGLRGLEHRFSSCGARA